MRKALTHFFSRKNSRAQGMVEFALILPVLLMLMFSIIEIARLLHAWLAVENGARYGVRYAVTGEFDMVHCQALYSTNCDNEAEEDGARIPSIKDVANAGAVAILKNSGVTTVGDPGYFKVEVCSSKVGVALLPPDPDVPTAATCVPSEGPGGPGDRVTVVNRLRSSLDYDHDQHLLAETASQCQARGDRRAIPHGAGRRITSYRSPSYTNSDQHSHCDQYTYSFEYADSVEHTDAHSGLQRNFHHKHVDFRG